MFKKLLILFILLTLIDPVSSIDIPGGYVAGYALNVDGGMYNITGDIFSNSSAFIVLANNVTLVGKNYTSGTNYNVTHGILSSGSGVYIDAFSNITIKNIDFIQGNVTPTSSHGITSFGYGNNLSIIGISMINTGDSYGFAPNGYSNVTILSSHFENTDYTPCVLINIDNVVIRDSSFTSGGLGTIVTANATNITGHNVTLQGIGYDLYLTDASVNNVFYDSNISDIALTDTVSDVLLVSTNGRIFNEDSSKTAYGFINGTYQLFLSGIIEDVNISRSDVYMGFLSQSSIEVDLSGANFSDFTINSGLVDWTKITGSVDGSNYEINNSTTLQIAGSSDSLINFTIDLSPGIYGVFLASNDVQITYPLSNTTIQRSNATHGDISINGTWTGSSEIEAQWGGGIWYSMTRNLSDSTFSGMIPDQLIGQASLTVRLIDDNSISDQSQNIGIGDVFLIAGQSNSQCVADNSTSLWANRTYNSTSYNYDGTWQVANDPYVCYDSYPIGSVWARLANTIESELGIPIGYIQTGVGGSDIASWNPSGGGNWSQMLTRLDAATDGTNDVKATLWYQGESDVGVTSYTYYNSLENVVDNFTLLTGQQVLVTQIGGIMWLPESSRYGIDNTRMAQKNAWNNITNASMGPSTYDINLSAGSGVHFVTDSEISTLATRWWRSINYSVYVSIDGRSAQLSYIYRNNNTLQITFDRDVINQDSPLQLEGFRIAYPNGTFHDVNITNSSISSSILTLVFNETLIENSNISLGSLNDGVGKNVPRDVFGYPVEAFVNYTISDVFLYPPVGLTATPDINHVHLNWTAIPNADKYSVYELTEGIPWFDTPPTLDGLIDTIYTNLSHNFRIRSPNPINSTLEDYYMGRDATYVYLAGIAYDVDTKSTDDHAYLYTDFNNDGLTADDIVYTITESGGTSRLKWSGSAWISYGGSGVTGITTGAGTNTIIYELRVPVSELPASWVNGSSITMLLERECTNLNPDVESFYPYGNINNTDTSMWQDIKLTNTTEYTWIANTTNNYYEAKNLTKYTWYRFGVSAHNGTQETTYATIDSTTLDVPSYSISGYILDNDTGLGILGATVWAQNGFVSARETTNATGYYYHEHFHNNTYRIFSSASLYTTNNTTSFVLLGANITNKNVTLERLPLYTVSGYVFDINGSGMSNAIVTIGEFTNISNVTGYYVVNGLLTGTYTGTASLYGYTSNEINIIVAGDDVENQNIILYVVESLTSYIIYFILIISPTLIFTTNRMKIIALLFILTTYLIFIMPVGWTPGELWTFAIGIIFAFGNIWNDDRLKYN